MTLLVLLALALSLDGLFAGIAYGIRRINIPLHSLVIIACCTAIGLSASMMLGDFAGDAISERMTRLIGVVVLGGIGVWQLFQGWIEYVRQKINERQDILKMQVKDLRFVLRVLREPILADTDRSGYIDIREALLLGLA